MEEALTVQSKDRRILTALLALLLPLLVLGVVMSGAVDQYQKGVIGSGHESPTPVYVVFGLLATTWVAVALWRIVHMRVELSRDGVRVHNFWVSRRVAWGEIVTVQRTTYMSAYQSDGYSYQAPALVLRTGRTLKMASFPGLGAKQANDALEALARFCIQASVDFDPRLRPAPTPPSGSAAPRIDQQVQTPPRDDDG